MTGQFIRALLDVTYTGHTNLSKELKDLGLIQDCVDTPPTVPYILTPKGSVYLNMLLDVPCPVIKYVDPRET